MHVNTVTELAMCSVPTHNRDIHDNSRGDETCMLSTYITI